MTCYTYPPDFAYVAVDTETACGRPVENWTVEFRLTWTNDDDHGHEVECRFHRAHLARQHGARWATQITEDEIMKIEQYDFGLSESEKPKPILAKVATFLPAIVFAVMLVLL